MEHNSYFLQAHTLYNACGARNPESRGWSERTFQVQNKYWQGRASVSLDDHENLIRELRSQLQSIGEEFSNGIDQMGELARQFDDEDTEVITEKRKYDTEFSEAVKVISVNCTNGMLKLAKRVMAEGIGMLKQSPPCRFNAVAIGSLARGEATPYSDLEYLFLMEKKSADIERYFELLAMTTYFIIGNLRETKLSYMAIDELEGWFDDKSINGFKIDGLALGAGNIPTGNGSEEIRNHFMVTSAELLERYRLVLENPTKEALRGDLTAMLTYMCSIFAYDQASEYLLKELKDEMAKLSPNEKRRVANMEMLSNDLTKFNFTPDNTLQEKGFTVNVKKQLYRFPSILLFDVCLMLGIADDTAWGTLDQLLNMKKISSEFHKSLKFQLASACFIRLAAYLYHGSHDDRISVAQRFTISDPNLKPLDEDEQQHRRWFVPEGLFFLLSYMMIPMKRYLCNQSTNIVESLISFSDADQFAQQDWVFKVNTLHSCGRTAGAFEALKDSLGADIYQEPQRVFDKMGSIFNGKAEKLEMLRTINVILIECSQYPTALRYAEYLAAADPSDENKLSLVNSYRNMSLYFKAKDVLTTINVHNGDYYLFNGMIESALAEFDKAEVSLILGLQTYSEKYLKEEATDYYGDPLPQNKLTETNHVNLVAMSPEERINFFEGNLTPRMVECIVLLCTVFDHNMQNKVGQQYEKKAKDFLTHIFGCYALIPSNAVILRQIAMHRGLIRGYSDLDFEKRHRNALAMLKKIYGDDADILDVARILRDIGLVYSQKGDHTTSIEYRKKSLAMLLRIFGEDSNHLDIAKLLNNLAADYTMLGEYETALSYFHKSLDMRRIIYGTENAHPDIALMLNNIGTTYEESGDLDGAKNYLRASLEMVGKIYGDRKPNRLLGAVHNNLGAVCNALEQFSEAETHLNTSLLYYASTDDHDGYTYGTAEALKRMSLNYLDMGRHKDGEDAARKALDLWIQMLGAESTNLHTGETSHYLANSLRKQGMLNESAEHYERALNIYKANRHCKATHAAALLMDVHDLHHEKGELQKAAFYLSQARDSMKGENVAKLRPKDQKLLLKLAKAQA